MFVVLKSTYIHVVGIGSSQTWTVGIGSSQTRTESIVWNVACYDVTAPSSQAWSSGRISFHPLHFHPSYPSHPEQLASLSQLHKALSPTTTFPLYHT